MERSLTATTARWSGSCSTHVSAAAIPRRRSASRPICARRSPTHNGWTWTSATGRVPGATREHLSGEILGHLRLVPGARETALELRARGYRLAVISGTLDLTLDLLFPEHPFEEVYTNRIWFDERGLIAGWEATPYDMEGQGRRASHDSGPHARAALGDGLRRGQYQ